LISQTALAAVLTILVESHEDTRTTLSRRALATKTLDLSVGLHLVVLQDRHLDLLAFMLDLLGGVISLFLALLSTTAKTKHQVKSGLLLNVVVAEGATILKLFTGKDQSLLVRGNSLLVLDLGLDIVNSIRGFNLESYGFAREGLYEDLHLE